MSRRPVRLGKRARRRAAWLLIIVLLAIVRRLPFGLAGAMGAALGTVAWPFLGRPRRTALANLDAAFGERLDAPSRRRIALGVFQHFGRIAAEWAILPRLSPAALGARVDTRALWPSLDRALATGHGAIALSAHLGHWEFLAAIGALRYPVCVVARRIYYEPFNRLVEGARRSLHLTTIHQDDSPRTILRALRSNHVVGILPDQDVFDLAGAWVAFFGRPAWTPTGPAAVARLAASPIVPMHLVRIEGRYRILVDEPIEVRRTEDRESDILEATERWTRAIERRIGEYPEQWPWFHERWRTTAEKLTARKRTALGASSPRPADEDGT